MRKNSVLRSATLLILAMGIPSAAHAAQPGPPSQSPADPPTKNASSSPAADFHTDLGLGTDFPLGVGGRLTVQLPGRWQLATSLGWLPPVYADAINATLIATESTTEAKAKLIKSALENAVSLRFNGGWKPWEDHGFYTSGGYGLFVFHGGVTSGAVVSAATGLPLPAGLSEAAPIDVSGTLHQLQVETGWQWNLAPRLLLRTAIGGAFTIAAASKLEPSTPVAGVPARLPSTPIGVVSSSPTDLLLRAGEERINSKLESSFHAPLISVYASYILF
jgi:hypothetical protein